MKKIYIFFIPIVFLFFINFSWPASAADSKFNQGLKAAGQGAGYPTAEADSNPGIFLAKMFGGVLAPVMTGVIGMLILSYGGWTLMMARGDEQKVEKAKAIIVNTVIALIIIYSTFAIVKLIIPLWEFVTR